MGNTSKFDRYAIPLNDSLLRLTPADPLPGMFFVDDSRGDYEGDSVVVGQVLNRIPGDGAHYLVRSVQLENFDLESYEKEEKTPEYQSWFETVSLEDVSTNFVLYADNKSWMEEVKAYVDGEGDEE